MNQKAYTNWVLLTSTTWEDISEAVNMIGIGFIDNDHRVLANYILDINKILIQLKSKVLDFSFIEKQKVILEQLYNYAVLHFRREEKMIGYYKLQCYETQKEQHEMILKMLKDTLADYTTGSISISEQLKMKLLEWLINHINKYDYQSYCIATWETLLKKAKRVQDIFLLTKNSGVRAIDLANRSLISMLIERFNEYEKTKDFASFQKSIEAVLSKISEVSSEKQKFMQLYKIPKANKIKAEHESLLALIKEKTTTVPENVSDLKYQILCAVINQMSILDYSKFNLQDITDKILINAKAGTEISWLIKRTGNQIIDTDHVHFVDFVVDYGNRISSCKDEVKAKQMKLEMTSSMVEYAQKHFSNEEEIMDKNPRLPGIAEHKIKHQDILKAVGETIYFINNDKGDVFSILRSKILNSWVNHTNSFDQVTFGNL